MLVNIMRFFYRPSDFMVQLKVNRRFPKYAFIGLLIFILFLAILLIPINLKTIYLQFSENIVRADAMMQIIEKMNIVQVFITVVVYILMLLLNVYLLNTVMRISKVNTSFVKVLYLMIFAYFILLLGDLANIGLVYLRGLDNISSQYDISNLLGLNAFFSPMRINPFLYTCLTYINPFRIWFFIILAKGLNIIFNCRGYKAIFILSFYFLILVVIDFYLNRSV